MTPEERRDRIQAIKTEQLALVRASALLDSERSSLRAFCQHEIELPADFLEKLKKDPWHSVGAYCKWCQHDFGWCCEESPVHYCQYDEENGEDCIHCGHPEERK